MRRWFAALSSRANAIWLDLPRSVRSFVIDATEGAIAAIALLNIVVPSTVPEAKAQAIIVGLAIASSVIAAARRRLLPAAIGWIVTTFPRLA